jgi:hypothetical protein
MIMLFYIGYWIHWQKTVAQHDRYFTQRINPAAFTLKTAISRDMWRLCQDTYEVNNIQYTQGISKLTYLHQMLEEQIPQAIQAVMPNTDFNFNVACISLELQHHDELISVLKRRGEFSQRN